MPRLEDELKELRKELSKIAKEVEKLKTRREQTSLWPQPGPPEPSASLIRVLAERLPDKPDAGMAFFGGIQKKNGKIRSSYFSGHNLESILRCSPKRVAKLLSPFSSEQRILILKTLIKGDKSSSELSQETGLEGGQLYHHLKELALSEYIEQKERGIYSLTEKGQMALLTVLAMACTLEKRIAPEEIEATFWETRKEEKTKQTN